MTNTIHILLELQNHGTPCIVYWASTCSILIEAYFTLFVSQIKQYLIQPGKPVLEYTIKSVVARSHQCAEKHRTPLKFSISAIYVCLSMTDWNKNMALLFVFTWSIQKNAALCVEYRLVPRKAIHTDSRAWNRKIVVLHIFGYGHVINNAPRRIATLSVKVSRPKRHWGHLICQAQTPQRDLSPVGQRDRYTKSK